MTRMSQGMSNSAQASAAPFIVGQSVSLPIKIPTSAFEDELLRMRIVCHRCCKKDTKSCGISESNHRGTETQRRKKEADCSLCLGVSVVNWQSFSESNHRATETQRRNGEADYSLCLCVPAVHWQVVLPQP